MPHSPFLQCLRVLLLTSVLGAGFQFSTAQGADRQRDQADKKVETRLYDVSILTKLIPDYPSPDIELTDFCGTCSAAPGISPFQAAPAQVITLQSIGDMIRNRIRPNSWDPTQGTSIEERGGMLVVCQRAEVHEEIRALLNASQKNMNKPLSVQALLVEVEAKSLAAYLGKGGKSFTEEEVREAVKAGKLRGTPQFLIQNSQRMHTYAAVESSYCADVDAAGDSPDPVIQRVFEGMVLDVRPTLSDDGRTASLEVRLTLNDQARIEAGASLSHTAASGRGANPHGLEAKGAAAIPPKGTVEPSLGRKVELEQEGDASKLMTATTQFQRASVDSQVLRTTLQLAVGRWTLASILPSASRAADPKPATSTLVFFLVNQVP